ncbi:DUF1801 domain-containing protein [Nitratireductor sp. CAU 1489]|uniref:DUF1801 domain-containing protein n=1 Tax=Nitratireductor arenosus TaxID=2682096 RepID=A0A844QE52_9HYPH|nr:DUF1801 domain-containing protein [Nitratireductor arenosus]MVA97582.1 DUF1801 domain-containing protein [Nitratireductor arenosus]
MAGNMTVQTGASVEDFLSSVEQDRRRREGFDMLDLMAEATGFEPRMWGPSIVGYGRYAYRYESGHSGQSFLTGFSPRKSALTVYIMPGFGRYGDELARLGRHRHSVSCLYLANLANNDRAVLADMVRDSVSRMKAKYPDWSAA